MHFLYDRCRAAATTSEGIHTRRPGQLRPSSSSRNAYIRTRDLRFFVRRSLRPPLPESLTEVLVPESRFESAVFGGMMALAMAYGMEVYNHALRNGVDGGLLRVSAA